MMLLTNRFIRSRLGPCQGSGRHGSGMYKFAALFTEFPALFEALLTETGAGGRRRSLQAHGRSSWCWVLLWILLLHGRCIYVLCLGMPLTLHHHTGGANCDW